MLGPLNDHNSFSPKAKVTGHCWDDPHHRPHHGCSKTGTAERTPTSSDSWGLPPEHNCSTAVVAASAVVAIECRSRHRIVVGRVDVGIQTQIAVAAAVAVVVVVVAVAVAVFLGIQVETKSLAVDTGRPSDCHVVAGCRATGVVACRRSLPVASRIGARETRTGTAIYRYVV